MYEYLLGSAFYMLTQPADDVVDYDATIGFTHWADKPSTKDAFVSLVYHCFLCILLDLSSEACHSMQKCRCYNHCQNQRTSDNVCL